MSLRQAPVDGENYRDVFDVGVSPEQQRYVDTAAEFLVIATYGPTRYVPLLLYDADDHVVGFAALRPPTAELPSVGLARFFISTEWQGRGLGARHLRQLLDDAASRWPRATTIELSVHTDAQMARLLYARAGFRDEGADAHDHRRMVLALRG